MAPGVLPAPDLAMSEGCLTMEARARVEIDRQLVACGWVVQDRKDLNLYAGQGAAAWRSHFDSVIGWIPKS